MPDPPENPAPTERPNTLNYARPRLVRAETDLYFPDRSLDLYVPVALLTVALLLGGGLLLYLRIAPKQVAVLVCSYLLVKLLILAVTIPLLAKVAGIAFGSLPSAVLKLMAIALLPESLLLGALVLLGPCLGVLIGLPIAFMATSLLFQKLFDMDTVEGRLSVAVMWAVALVFGLVWWKILGWLMTALL